MPETNQRLADLFTRIADILEIKGENPFRVRAYRRAAGAVAGLGEEVGALVRAGEATAVPGIGKDLAAKMAEFAETGRLEYLERLEKEIPPGLTDLLEIQGLGPKTVALFHEKLGICGLGDLEKALASGALAALPGVREKTLENIRRGVALYRRGRERRPLPEVWEAVESLRAAVAGFPGVARAEAAGSFRRRRETVGDADLLAVAGRGGEGAKIVARFAALPGVERVLARGGTRGSVEVGDGFQVDLRVVPPASFGAALQYFTGARAHGVRLRGIAHERGLKLNEYGLFRGKRRVAGADEEGIYRALGLAWIPPELREDRGEIEAAREGRLPEGLLTPGDIRGDLHLHSEWSDGRGSLEAMARAAAALGRAYIAVTDHSPTARVARGLSLARLEEKRAALARLAGKMKKPRLLMGAEVEILKGGTLDYPDEVLRSLDVVVAGLHYATRMDRDRLTGRLLDALDHPVHVLAHPTGRLLGRRAPYDVDLDRVLERCAERGVAVEVSASPKRLDLNDVAARRAVEIGCLIAVGTDAHRPEALSNMGFGVNNARRGWVERGRVVNAWPWAKLKRWLEKRRRG